MSETISTATSDEPKAPRKFRGVGISLLLLLGLSIFYYLNFTVVVVNGPSMENTYESGQRLLATKAYWLVGPIKQNDIVVIRMDKNEYIIKRVYRLGGEIVDFPNVPDDHKLTDGEYKVPPGDIYVLGDNRTVSEDSRKFGSVSASKVIGKVLVF